MTRKNKIFLVLCAVLLATDVGLVAINAATARDALMAAMRDRAAWLRDGFDIAVYTTELKLSEIASFVAQIDDVKSHLAGAGAVLAGAPASGGGVEPPEVDRWRRSLMEIVGPRWTQLRFRYLLRQLTFYTPPGETVLLRADVPYAYGDRAQRPESLAARVALTGKPASGFDIDRMGVGIRAAVPVESDRPLGVVEVGTAFDTMLIPICPNPRCGAAILLDRTAVEARMAPEAVAATFTDDRRIGERMIEASTNPAIARALAAPGRVPPVLGGDGTADLVEIGARWLAVTTFPLRDHLGKEEPSRPPVGTVVAWLDVDEAVHAFERSQYVNVAFAAGAFLLVAGLIRLLLNAVTRRLEGEIERRTAEVQRLLAEVSHLASRDPLTDLFNRRAFTARLHEETARARRGGSGFSLVSIDLDGFKRVNDAHGHPTGDEVLRMVAAAMRETARTQDVAARMGGEEFCLLLPDTGVEGAVVLAERLRARVAGRPVPTPDGGTLTVTLSAGVAGWRSGWSEEDLLRAVDRALYAAKEGGRNRVVRLSDSAPDNAAATDLDEVLATG